MDKIKVVGLSWASHPYEDMMADPGRLDELKRKFDENPRRYFAPLANEYRKHGEFDRAIELCRAYLPHQPGHMSGYIVYGQSLFDAGRGHEAAEIFQQALQLDPENVIALRHLGDIARLEGNTELAMQWYGRVLELDPKNEEITGYIATLASPGTPMRAPTGFERPTPPTIRPEPEHVDDAVALEDLMAQPDEPQPTFEATGWSGVQAAQESRDSKWAPPPKHVVEPAEEIQPKNAEQMFEILAAGESALEPSIVDFLNDRSTSTTSSVSAVFEFVPQKPAESVSASQVTEASESEVAESEVAESEVAESEVEGAEVEGAEKPEFEPLTETPVKLPPELPVKVPTELPVELPPELPVELPPDLPIEIPLELPAESLMSQHSAQPLYELSTPEDVLPPMLEPDVVANLQEMERQLHVEMGTEVGTPHESASDVAPASALNDAGDIPLVTTFEMMTPLEPALEPQPAASFAEHAVTAEPEYEREPEPEEPLDIGTPFITETMAALYLQQGFTAEALDVYRKLAATRDEPRLHDKVRELEAKLTVAPTAEAGETVRVFFARIGARKPDARNVVHAAAPIPADVAVRDASSDASQSTSAQVHSASGLGALFQSASIDEGDMRAAQSLSNAFPAQR